MTRNLIIPHFFLTVHRQMGDTCFFPLKSRLWKMYGVVWFNTTLKINTIRCKKLSTIVPGQKNVSRLFFRRKQISTSAALLLHFGTRAYLFSSEERSFFRPERYVSSFLHPMVLIFKVLSNHSSKRQILVLHWRQCMEFLISLIRMMSPTFLSIQLQIKIKILYTIEK